MKLKKISVIIPIYNMEAYLERCLNSILYNTYTDLEIICIDDGSRDKSLEILLELQKKDERIIVLSQPNGGVSSARNYGLKVSTGDFIAFIDADDWIHHRYFEILMNCIDKYRLDIGICSYIWTSNFQKDKEELNESYDCKVVSYEQFFANHMTKSFLWGRLYNSKILKGLRFDESLNIGEDLLFNAKLICFNRNLKIGVLNKELYYYYVRETSITHSIEVDQTLPMIEKLYDLANNHCQDDDYKKIYYTETIKKSMALRYYASYVSISEQKKEKNNMILSTSVRLLLQNKKASKIQWLIVYLMWKFPCLYRQIRVLKDKTLLDWEKNCCENK